MIAGLVVCAALVVAFRAAPGAMLVVTLLIAVLIGAGTLTVSAVPGVAQITGITAAAQRWSNHQTNAASCAYRQLVELESDDAGSLGLVQRDCSMNAP